jgi:two-component system chemotaxis sensor kinase CheA
MTIDMTQFFQTFFEETEELLAETEQLLLGIDVNNPEAEQLNAIFRAAHSIKGGSATFGFNNITVVTHELETLLDRVRKGDLALQQSHIDIFLLTKDVIESQLNNHRNGIAIDPTQEQDILSQLHEIATGASFIQDKPTETRAPKREQNVYELELPPSYASEINDLQAELAILGQVTLVEQKEEQIVLSLLTDENEQSIVSICAFIVDTKDLKITRIANSALTRNAGTTSEDLGYGFFEPSAFSAKNVGSAENAVDLSPVVLAQPRKKTTTKAKIEKMMSQKEASSIRVGVEKVDQLINLVGELIITQSMIEQQVSLLDPNIHIALINSINQLTRNTRDLQESSMAIRMMPMNYVFSRFPRMVHDLSIRLGKQTTVVMTGATTELDKGLIERIIDPLTHLVRNSIDHGIEIPSVRKQLGKSEVGKLSLSATNRGSSIVIEVSDDGAGLDRQLILNKAMSRGLDVSENMSDNEVWQLIFAPGFSTAEVVTEVSGRGFGMDVVKRNIGAMGGTIVVKSARGFGTSVTLSLPLTLAILHGMTVALASNVYVIPISLIIETLQPKIDDIKTVTGQGLMVLVRGEYIPIIVLYALFNQKTEITHPSKGVLVIVETEGKKAAILVDALLGQQQVVIKSLETHFKRIPGLSGATIMADGSVALILDVPAILQSGQHQYSSGEMQ